MIYKSICRESATALNSLDWPQHVLSNFLYFLSIAIIKENKENMRREPPVGHASSQSCRCMVSTRMSHGRHGFPAVLLRVVYLGGGDGGGSFVPIA